MKKSCVLAAFALTGFGAAAANAGAILEAPSGAAWAGVSPYVVTYDPAAPTGNFGSADDTTNSVPYDVYVRDDGTYYYIDLQTTGSGAGTSFPDEANLYFDTDPQNNNGTDVGFEIGQKSKTKNGVTTYTYTDSYFIPLDSGPATQNDASSYVTDAFSTVSGTSTIEIAIANSFFTSGPEAGLAYPNGYPIATGDVELTLSQTFGSSVNAPNLNASVVPLPASAWSGLALLGGLGLFGAVKRHRKQMA